MARRRVQYGAVDASDADVGAEAPGFRTTWHSKEDLREQLMEIDDVPKDGRLYFWDGELWLRWEALDDLPGPEEDPLRIMVVRPQNAGASLIQAEDAPRLSAFLADWDESRRKSSIRSAQVSNINTELWNTVRQTARLTVASYEGSMSPTHTKKFPAYQWVDRYEGSQADRYMPYILQNIKVDSRQWQWVDVQGQRNLLTQVSKHTLGYNFKGTTDIILCSRNAVRSHIYTSGMRVLLEVKKAPVHDDSYQAMVILLLANSLSPNFKPVVVLTDLRDSWVFFWLEGQCIWHSAQDRPAAAGILEDMLEHEELKNSEVQTLPKEDCDRLGIYKRHIFDPNADGHKDQQDTSLADTIDSLSAEEAAITKVQYMLDLFKQIPGVPMPERMGP